VYQEAERTFKRPAAYTHPLLRPAPTHTTKMRRGLLVFVLLALVAGVAVAQQVRREERGHFFLFLRPGASKRLPPPVSTAPPPYPSSHTHTYTFNTRTRTHRMTMWPSCRCVCVG